MLRAVANQAAYVGAFTFATLPAAASYSGQEAFASDWGANGTRVRSNGTRWLPLGGQVTLKKMGAASSNIANTSTIVLQFQLPINAWQVNDTIRVVWEGTKSGTTDSGLWNFYVGTAGTTADTAVVSAATAMLAANQSVGVMQDIKLTSVTGALRIGSIAGTGSFTGSNNAASGASTVSDASANSLWVSLAILSGGATNTVLAQDATIYQITG